MSKEHKVQQGECISSIADKYGFFPDTIWNDSANAKLKRKRKDPNVLFPGDVVVIPDKELKEESGATEKRHRFRRKGLPEKLIIYFRLSDDEPRANEAYILEIDGALSEGETDGDGRVEIAIPPEAVRGRITFRDSGDEYELELGDLDPITEISGVQGRLRDLGFYDGPVDGKDSDELRGAIAAFQKSKNLPETGKLDEDTEKNIQDAFGG